jgi:hypothetical protein
MIMVYAGIVAGDMMEMNKQKFLKFMVDEIERQQKDMYKSGEGKKVVAVLSQIYTLTSDGKFDVHSNRGEEISDEIKGIHHAKSDTKNLNKGQPVGSYDGKRPHGKITGPWNHNNGGE